MIYYYLWVFAPWMFRAFFRTLSSHGLENLPKKGPILFAVNHPNSFVDAIVVGCVLYRYTFWTLVRGDVFNTGWKRALLRQVFLLPIFRKSEGGRENRAKNDATFEICHGLFKKQQNVLIFAEGLCVIEKRMRPLAKGTARVALGSEEAEDFKMGLTVVPVGVNYSAPGTMRQDVSISFGKALPLQSYKVLYEENKAKAVNQLTADIKAGMEANIVIIPDPEKDDITEELFEIARPNIRQPWWKYRYRKNRSMIDLEKKVAYAVEDVSKTDQWKKLQALVADYRVKLNEYKANSLSLSEHLPSSALLGLLYPIFAVLGYLGYLLNYLPYRFARNFANQKIKKLEFYDSVFAGLWLVGTTLVYYPIIWLTSAAFGSGIWGLVAVILLGFCRVIYRRIDLVRIALSGQTNLARVGKLEELRMNRNEILGLLNL